MQNTGNTNNSLDFTYDYEEDRDWFNFRLEGLAKLLERHEEIAREDTNGLGHISYGRVAELRKALRSIGDAIDTLIDGIEN